MASLAHLLVLSGGILCEYCNQFRVQPQLLSDIENNILQSWPQHCLRVVQPNWYLERLLVVVSHFMDLFDRFQVCPPRNIQHSVYARANRETLLNAFLGCRAAHFHSASSVNQRPNNLAAAKKSRFSYLSLMTRSISDWIAEKSSCFKLHFGQPPLKKQNLARRDCTFE